MGTLAANFYPHQWIFGAGVISAAFVWYTFLGTLGATLAKPLNKPKTWKVINIIIGIICVYMATQFIQNINQPAHEHNHINLFSIFGMDDNVLESMHEHEHGEHGEHDHSQHHDHEEDNHDGHNHDEHNHDEYHKDKK